MNLRPLWGERRSAGALGAGLAILLGLILNFSLPFGLKMLWRRILDRGVRDAIFCAVVRFLGPFASWRRVPWLVSLLVCTHLLTTAATAQSVYSTAYTFTTFAGKSATGSADGVGDAAQFKKPASIAVDGAGSLYVADTYNSTIRKITAAGVVSTLAGFAGSAGSADGTGSNARFNLPYGVAADGTGNVYVADTYNNTIRKITAAGVVSSIAGSAGHSGTNDGTSSNARFNLPCGIAVDNAGNVYVADTYNYTIRKITAAGVVSTIAGSAGSFGTNDGTGSNARFNQPSGIAADSMGSLYVADATDNTIRKVTAVGTNWVISTIAGSAGHSGTNDGTSSNARFYQPFGIAVDGTGTLYVADTYNHTIRKITAAGVVSTLAGLAGSFGSTDGTGTTAQFYYPYGIAVDSVGYTYVVDTGNCAIRQITSAGVVSTLAGLAGSRGSANGTGSDARFYQPYGIAVDSAGYVYVADTFNYTIRKITSAAVVSTLAGLAGSFGTNDGTGTNARFYYPFDIAADSAGSLYVADTYNYTIRKITSAGVVSTIAGSAGHSGTNDGTSSNARFNLPCGIAVDNAGNVYVADTYNYTIRKITAARVVSTLAGLAGSFGTNDGTGSNARFNLPYGVTVDGGGTLYVTDAGNDTIRKVTAAGVVSTLAGSAGSSGSADGAGSNARFYSPLGIAVDGAGNLYLRDEGNNTIRKITSAGVVSTIAGSAGSSGSADGTGGDAQFGGPGSIAVDAAGSLFVADIYNNAVRKGVFSQYTPTNPVPFAPPPMNAQLVVTLLPLEANGQWRFPWDLNWRDGGQAASNLVAGNYPVEFRNPPGYLAYPPTVTVAVANGVTAQVTNQYYPTLNLLGTTNTGALTVNIGPSAPSGAGWQFLGEMSWRAPGSTATNLLPDSYAIEFAPITNYSKPASQAVQVPASSTTVIWAGYLLAQSPPAGVNLPVPVPTNSINDLTNYPYGFNGQLQSDVGYGSGVAVQTNVVLTAAHLVFNDQTLSYVSQVYWRFQQEAGVFAPEPLAARGWYVLSGYAAQRTNDVLGGLGPNQSSPQSRNLDVAALYFPSPVAGGGYGGYLPSDTVPNSWLTSTSQKMLVGYPVDGSLLGDASIVPGVMYQIGPQPYPLSLATDPVADQQVYTAPWLLSYPGNSGGPLYVQFNGYYYPAGVYLGTLYNGIQPYASLVRGIDSNVVTMITYAQTLGDSGTNSSGGVITITAGTGSGAAYVQVPIGPAEAVAAGAAWRRYGTTDWISDPLYTLTIAGGTSVTLEFKPIPGWNQPTNNTVQIVLRNLTIVPAIYTPNPAQMAVMPAGGLASSGYTGGPFSPAAITYTLTNGGGAALNWSASTAANWLTLTASSGTLAAGASTNVTVSVNANANSLAPGSYSDAVGFTNLNNNVGNTAYPMSLLVNVHPAVQFTGVRLLTNGAVAMTLQGVTGRVYSIVASTNLLNRLTNWAEVLRLTNTAGQTVFTNQSPTNAPRYYRAKEL